MPTELAERRRPINSRRAEKSSKPPESPPRRCSMSFTFNRVTLVARAAANPEVRLTSGGQRVATLNLATDRPGRGGATPITDWHRVICWDKLAEIAVEHVTRGRLLFVDGLDTYRTCQDQQNQKHTMTEI